MSKAKDWKFSDTTEMVGKELEKMSADEISFNAELVCAVTKQFDLVKNDNDHDVRYKGKYFMLMVLNQIVNRGW